LQRRLIEPGHGNSLQIFAQGIIDENNVCLAQLKTAKFNFVSSLELSLLFIMQTAAGQPTKTRRNRKSPHMCTAGKSNCTNEASLCQERTCTRHRLKITIHNQAKTTEKKVRRLKITHRFEVAVDDVFTVQQAQTLDQRLGESLDQIEAEALVVIFLNQLVQVETVEQNTHTL
jgi:hypothetical protein